MALGVILGLTFQNLILLSLIGNIFVSALKAVAPVLVFALVISSLAQWKKNGKSLPTFLGGTTKVDI